MPAKKIILIDDNTHWHSVISLILGRVGYEVLHSSTGRDGIKKASEALPDLVLLDVMMPDLDGGAVAFQIKEDESIKNMPIVFH